LGITLLLLNHVYCVIGGFPLSFTLHFRMPDAFSSQGKVGSSNIDGLDGESVN